MATTGYVGDIQPAAQPQGAGVTVAPGPTDATTTPAAATQFLAEIQTTVVTPAVISPPGQATQTDPAAAIVVQKPAAGAQAPPTPQSQPAQTQYVTAEIQGSPTQSGNAQSTPQYIVVTVTGRSIGLLCVPSRCDGSMLLHRPIDVTTSCNTKVFSIARRILKTLGIWVGIRQSICNNAAIPDVSYIW